MTDEKDKESLHTWLSHHPACNYQIGDPMECSQCKRLYRDYPIEELSEEGWIAWLEKYFPDVISR